MAMIPWWIHYPNVNNEIINLDWILQVSNENTELIKNFIGINTIKYADPILWDITSQYEANTIVVDPQTGDAYISTKAVPYGVALSNESYWTRIYNYASEIHTFREQIAADEQLSTTATAPRSVDDLVFLNGLLYIITAPMIAGDSYVEGSNCAKTTINAQLLRLHTSIGAEAEARAEADTAEAEARAEADTALGERIDDEAESRAEADSELRELITEMSDVIIDVTKHGVSASAADNAEAIQALLNEYSGKGILYFPEGTYKTGVVNIPSNTHIILNGELKLKDNANSQLIQGSSISNIIIEGYGSLNGNKANQESALAIACILFGDASSTTYNVNNVLIKGITVKNALYWGACVIGDNITFEKVTFANNNYMSFIGPHSKNGKFIDCIAYGVTEDWGLGFYGGVDGGLIDNCIAYNNNETGLGALSDTAQPTPSNNIKITNCTCYENQMGIACGGWTGLGYNIIITNNYCHDAANGNLYEAGGIFISNSQQSIIADNLLIGNEASGNGAEVVVVGENTRIEIGNNVMKNSTGHGIVITGAAIVECKIHDNDINATNAIEYLGVTACVDNWINDNILKGVVYIPFTDEIYLRDNSKATMVTGSKTFTPDGTTTTFSITLEELDLFGEIENVMIMPVKDYGETPLIDYSGTLINITYSTAPNAGYGSLKFNYIIFSNLY